MLISASYTRRCTSSTSFHIFARWRNSLRSTSTLATSTRPPSPCRSWTSPATTTGLSSAPSRSPWTATIEREMVSVLLSALYSEVVSAEQMARGVHDVLDALDDLVLDVPDAVDQLATFIARAVVDDILPPSFVSQLPNGMWWYVANNCCCTYMHALPHRAKHHRRSSAGQVQEPPGRPACRGAAPALLGQWGGALPWRDQGRNRARGGGVRGFEGPCGMRSVPANTGRALVSP